MPLPSNGRQPRRFPPEILTDGEVRRLLDACSPRAPAGIRNQALIAVLYRAGLRISEALDLWPKDIDLESGSIRVLHGKGGRARTVGIDPAAGTVVDRWLQVRAELDLDGRHPALCTLAGSRMGDAYVRVLLPRLARKAGIDKRVHAHGLRHTHAAQLRVEGVDIGIISKQLGHRSIATTARYLDHIAPQQVIETIRQRPWQASVAAAP
jgi:site-specific recombinase XerD